MRANMRMLFRLFRNNPLYVSGYFLNQILISLPSYLVNVLFLKTAIESISVGGDVRVLSLYFAVLALFLILSDLYGSWFSQIAQPKANENYSAMFSDQLKQAAGNTALSGYDDPVFYNDFSFLTEHVLSIADTILDNLSKMVAGILNLCLTLSMLRSVGLELLLFAAVSVAVSFLYNKRSAEFKYQIKTELVPYERRLNYFTGCFFRSDCVKERKMSHIDEVFTEKAAEASEDIRRIHRRKGGRLAFYSFMKGFVPGTLILNFGLLAFLLYKNMVEHSITVAEFVASFNGINVIVSSAMFLFGQCFANIRESEITIRKFERFISIGPAGEGGERKVTNEAPKRIELKNVCFSYPGREKAVLKDINLILEPGKKTAIVGRNGSGKSTLTYLIMGLYEPQSGEILIDGIPKKAFSTRDYQRLFTSFFQNETPWPATIAENVAFHTEYDKERGRDALCRSGLVSLAEGQMDRLIGKEFDKEGMILSGGQMQKLMLAHCFYDHKPYIIMDEPSSALDPSAEAAFNQQVARLEGDATLLFISHRLTTVEMADYIYVVDDGKIVQQGTHQKLRQEEGLYRQMWEIQMRGGGKNAS